MQMSWCQIGNGPSTTTMSTLQSLTNIFVEYASYYAYAIYIMRYRPLTTVLERGRKCGNSSVILGLFIFTVITLYECYAICCRHLEVYGVALLCAVTNLCLWHLWQRAIHLSVKIRVAICLTHTFDVGILSALNTSLPVQTQISANPLPANLCWGNDNMYESCFILFTPK